MFNELAAQAKEGNKEAIEIIITKLQPLIKSSIRRYYYKPKEFDDLVQDGNIKILECIEDYDPSKGVFFLGYIKTSLRYLYLDKHKIRIHQSLNETTKDGEMELIDLLISEGANVLDQVVEQERNIKLKKSLDILTERQREVVLLYYSDKMIMEDIGKKLGISHRTVVNTKTRALEKIRGVMINEKS